MAEKKRFSDQVVWIVGASSGFGAALAHGFDQAGARLVLSARRAERLQSLAASMHQAAAVPLDLAQANSLRDKAAVAQAVFGRIDCLVLAGALAQQAPVQQVKHQVERQVREVDYFSQTLLARSVLPHMLERGTGQIVVVSGLLAQLHLPGRSSYAAAKAALEAYFGCLRSELVLAGAEGISVTVLVPGAMQTAFGAKALGPDGQARGGNSSAAGCPVGLAAGQSLRAIAERKAHAYIGLEDASHELWRLAMAHPQQGIERVLQLVRGQRDGVTG